MNGRCFKLLSLALAISASLALTAVAQETAQPPAGPECKDNGECDRAQYCQRRAGKCQGPGNCEVRPQACPEIFDPVCGCDGRTYGNACFAAMAGVNVRKEGACPGNCSTNQQCGEGEYCAKPTGQCGGRGVCTPRPQACTRIFDPVCGCDKQTYSNFCVAAAAGVNAASLGECAK